MAVFFLIKIFINAFLRYDMLLRRVVNGHF
jgi:hypothetical protein